MRPTLIFAVIAALLLPSAALAFDANSPSRQNPDGSAGFSDPDEAPAIPGLEAYGIDSDSAQSSGVYIPQSPASSDVPALLYSSSAFRSH
ncbi:hypothetical protein [Methyloceanibacter sp.]|uniref:hypothetical protein n=1 Tax=Methyloceanibacter sp. TaxID=1965321 RepID=UPI003D6CC6E5